MPARRALTRSLAVAAAVAVVAGCSDDEEEEDPAASAVTVDSRQGVEVRAGEYFFDPEAIVVDGGSGPLEITLENEGNLAHNLRVFDGEEDIGGTPTFTGGEARSGTVELDPGAYRFVCTVSDHEELGMVGDLEVR
jgi:plastocyanin